MSRIQIGIDTLPAVFVLLLILSTQFTLFAVQLIGADPEGWTLVLSRLSNGEFIDSADAMSGRLIGGASFLCRIMPIGPVVHQAKIYERPPYSSTL